MKTYKILQFVIHSYYKICEMETDTKEQAIDEFLKMNTAYVDRCVIAKLV